MVVVVVVVVLLSIRCCSVVEERSGVTGTPFGFARGVVAPSMAISSVVAELLTGRNEAMIGDVRGGGG